MLFGGAGNDCSLAVGQRLHCRRRGQRHARRRDGNDFLDGDQGADVGFLGAGNDVFRWDQGDGSDRVDGGSGFDEMLFNGFAAGAVHLFGEWRRHALFTRVQGNIVMDLHDIEKITVNALAGADTITINDPTGTDVTEIDINLGVNGVGDGAADTININDDDAGPVVDNGNGNLTIFGCRSHRAHHGLRGRERSSGHQRPPVRLNDARAACPRGGPCDASLTACWTWFIRLPSPGSSGSAAEPLLTEMFAILHSTGNWNAPRGSLRFGCKRLSYSQPCASYQRAVGGEALVGLGPRGATARAAGKGGPEVTTQSGWQK